MEIPSLETPYFPFYYRIYKKLEFSFHNIDLQ